MRVRVAVCVYVAFSFVLAFPGKTGITWPPDPAEDMITVCSSGCDYPSIQAAVDAAESGDTILLGPETFYENVEVAEFGSLTIRGMGPARTIVDGNDYDVVFALLSGESLVLSDLTVQHGYSLQFGGGIVAIEIEELLIENCLVRDNVACDDDIAIPMWGGGLLGYLVRELTVSDSTFRDNRCSDFGGGISMHYGERLQVQDSTFADNAAHGIWVRNDLGHVTLENSTVSGSSEGIFVRHGTLTLSHSTVTGAHYSGVSARWATLNASHSIVDSLGLSGRPVCAFGETTVISLGHNLEADGSCGFDQPTDITHENPMLLPLASYGGPTQTHALHPDSPAIDAGGESCLPTDQRGVPRPFDGDFDGEAACDIGAFELGIHGSIEVLGELNDIVLKLQGQDSRFVAPVLRAIQLLADEQSENDAESLRSLLAFVQAASPSPGSSLSSELATTVIEHAWEIIRSLLRS